MVSGGARLAGEDRLGADLVDLVLDVVEVPAPLLPDDVDRDVGLLGVSTSVGLVTGGVVEEHDDHEDRDDGVEDLDRDVVAQLDGQLVVVLAAAVGDDAPADQAPDQGPDGEGAIQAPIHRCVTDSPPSVTAGGSHPVEASTPQLVRRAAAQAATDSARRSPGTEAAPGSSGR